MDVVATINPILPAIFATVHDFSLTYNPPARNDDPARVRNPLIPPSLGGDDGIIITMELADRAEMQRYQGVGGAGWCEKNRNNFEWIWLALVLLLGWRESPAGISRHHIILHVAVTYFPPDVLALPPTQHTKQLFGGKAPTAAACCCCAATDNSNNNNKTTSRATSSLRS